MIFSTCWVLCGTEYKFFFFGLNSHFITWRFVWLTRWPIVTVSGFILIKSFNHIASQLMIIFNNEFEMFRTPFYSVKLALLKNKIKYKDWLPKTTRMFSFYAEYCNKVWKLHKTYPHVARVLYLNILEYLWKNFWDSKLGDVLP